jgi:predicted nucleic acid-binding Zn ribbon protein
MSQDDFDSSSRSEAARALVVGSERECPGCGTPLAGRQRAGSGKCRARVSRQRKATARQHRDDELRVLALAARQAIEALERRLATRS